MNFKEFFKISNTHYMYANFNGVYYLKTRVDSEFKPRLFHKRDIDSVKILEVTAPMMVLFESLANAKVDKANEEFEDMTTYSYVSDVTIRKRIRDFYNKTLVEEINYLLNDFEKWCNNFRTENKDKLTKKEIDGVLHSNRTALNATIEQLKKENNASSTMRFVTPNEKTNKDLANFQKFNCVKFLYTQIFNSNLCVTYYYDMDVYGTITIYEVMTVKGFIKNIETYRYNKKIITEFLEKTDFIEKGGK